MSKPGTYIWRYEIVLRDAKTIVNDKTPASAEVFKAFKDYLAGGSNRAALLDLDASKVVIDLESVLAMRAVIVHEPPTRPAQRWDRTVYALKLKEKDQETTFQVQDDEEKLLAAYREYLAKPNPNLRGAAHATDFSAIAVRFDELVWMSVHRSDQ